MARTPDMKRRAEIAAHAFEVLREKGLRRTGMAEVAAALGMKRPTLYWYFKDLGELFDAVLAEAMERAARFVADRIMAAPRHPIDLLHAFLRAVSEFHADSGGFVIGMLQLWAAGAPQDAERVLARSRAQAEAWRNLAIGVVEAGIRAGQVVPCDAAALVDAVRAIADGLTVQAAVGGSGEAGALLDLVRDRLLEPLRADGGRSRPSPFVRGASFGRAGRRGGAGLMDRARKASADDAGGSGERSGGRNGPRQEPRGKGGRWRR